MPKSIKIIIPLCLMLLISCGKKIGVPELKEPTGGEEVSLPVTFIWTSVEDADHYIIEISTATDFANPVISTSAGDTTFTTSNLDTLKYTGMLQRLMQTAIRVIFPKRIHSSLRFCISQKTYCQNSTSGRISSNY